mmetsp:Transcript_37592/g.121203  ORF Transcript_37592/g.121203 Transcript_37592/m.121203 type:complete len:276 (-) Transcript_37592:213-1040(-)
MGVPTVTRRSSSLSCRAATQRLDLARSRLRDAARQAAAGRDRRTAGRLARGRPGRRWRGRGGRGLLSARAWRRRRRSTESTRRAARCGRQSTPSCLCLASARPGRPGAQSSCGRQGSCPATEPTPRGVWAAAAARTRSPPPRRAGGASSRRCRRAVWGRCRGRGRRGPAARPSRTRATSGRCRTARECSRGPRAPARSSLQRAAQSAAPTPTRPAAASSSDPTPSRERKRRTRPHTRPTSTERAPARHARRSPPVEARRPESAFLGSASCSSRRK